MYDELRITQLPYEIKSNTLNRLRQWPSLSESSLGVQVTFFILALDKYIGYLISTLLAI